MKNGRKMLWINCIAVVTAGLFLLLPFLEKTKPAQYDIVFLGDSIIGNNPGGLNATEIVANQLGKSTFNGAFGGTTFSFDEGQLWGSVTTSQLSMVKLAEAIAYDDWKSQLGAVQYIDAYYDVNSQASFYFKDKMQALSKIDFEQVEILVIEHGTNDYNNGRRLDNPEDLFDITTFGGALRHSLKVLKEAYPDMQIVLLSPIYCEFGENTCYSWDQGYGTLEAYVQLEQEIAREYGVMHIDAYHGSGIWEETVSEDLYDGLHVTAEGARKLGNLVAECLEEFIAE